MKIGFNMLLWTTKVGEQHRAILEDLRTTGYDGIEVPIFEGKPHYYDALGRSLAGEGLEATAITVVPSHEMNPIGDDPAQRAKALDYVKWAIDCTAALGARTLCGPLHSTLGHFSGAGPGPEERGRALEFHHLAGDHAAAADVTLALEALNRFECYFLNTMDDLGAYLEEVNHPAVSGMYDTFHANIEEKDPLGAIGRNMKHIAHVHISENDRGTPGSGHVDLAGTFRALKAGGYDGWLTIEAFGRTLPELAAATRVWRDFAPTPADIYRKGYRAVADGWAGA